jgi:G3E family GTPase
MKKVEIIILSGFLGSGKSTLLQKFLQEEKSNERKVAVLMNEVGEYSVDSAVVEEDIPLIELLKGCICCSLKDEVEIQLLELYKEHQPDVIYIETTGVAHPIEVLDSCLSPLIAPIINVKSIVTVVDAAQWLAKQSLNLKLQKLLVEQVKYADDILINKKDKVTEKDVQEIEKAIVNINPRANIHVTAHAKISLSSLQNIDVETKQEKHEAIEVDKHLHIQTMTYTFSGPISKAIFQKWLRSIPNTIYRMKGFIEFVEFPGKTINYQYTFGGATYLPINMSLPNTIVLIGNHLDKNKISAELAEIEDKLK